MILYVIIYIEIQFKKKNNSWKVLILQDLWWIYKIKIISKLLKLE